MKVVIITGASRGLGAVLARTFFNAGAAVVATGRSTEPAWKPVGSGSGRYRYIRADLSEEVGRDSAAFIVLAALDHACYVNGTPQIDALVNNAGIFRRGKAHLTLDDDWTDTLSVNVSAPFRLIGKASAYMPRGASIVNVSSINADRPFPGCAAYNVSKAALNQLTRSAAIDLAPLGIRVNAVNPGFLETGLHEAAGLSLAERQALAARAHETHPIYDDPQPSLACVADTVLFLTSESARWITGACVPVDGGRHLTVAR